MADVMKVTPGVRRTALLTAQVPGGVRVDRFFYPQAGHTHWHSHSGEQVLYGESGRGWVKFAGAERVAISPGEIVHVPVGLRHWHGATPDGPLVHLAVTAGGDTTWLGELSPDEYPGD
jgi:quercetin dioxygenase-like cupin family protein